MSSHRAENQSIPVDSPVPTASHVTEAMPDHPATSHPTSWSQTQERAKTVSAVSWWIQPRKPDPLLTHRIVSKINDSRVKPFCFRAVCYTVKASWCKFQEKALRPPKKPQPQCSLGWSESIPITNNRELAETLNAAPGRQNQTGVPSLSPFPIWRLLPLCYPLLVGLHWKGVCSLFPRERREAGKELTYSSFLMTLSCPTQHTYAFLVPLLAHMYLE